MSRRSCAFRIWSRRRQRCRLATAVLVGCLIAALGTFYIANWSAVQQLPTLVHRRLVRHNAPWTPLTHISPWFTRALIATEDRTFYTNWGISFQGIARAAWVDFHTGHFTQGGSTITQQLIRDMLLSPVKTLQRKVSGTLLSVLATVLYPKTTLLALYVNEVYLGDGAYGVGEAAQRYFDLAPSQLNLAEAALLAGLPQAPSFYDPCVHYREAKIRQRQVLQSMVQDHMISPGTARAAYKMPLPLDKHGTSC